MTDGVAPSSTGPPEGPPRGDEASEARGSAAQIPPAAPERAAALVRGIRATSDQQYATPAGPADEAKITSPLLQISNAMVRLYKEAFGRGPTKARAQFAGPDTLVVVLEDSLTPAERNLVAMNEHNRLREARLFVQYALETEFRSIIERTLGRRTVAFISGIDTHHDVSVEIFTLAPQREDAEAP